MGITQRIDSLDVLMPEFAARVHLMVMDARAQGLNVAVFETLRSDARQEELWNQGRLTSGAIVTNARAGASWHNYGLAVDIAFLSMPIVSGKLAWTWTGDWKLLGKIGMQNGLAWLGAPGSTFPEAPHFQLTCGMSLNLARRLRSSGGLPSVWNEVRQRLQLPKGVL
jgi:peptidoglycan L-alanyl-D-glutamate endopeptidase CwlK